MQKYDDSDVFDEHLLNCSFCGDRFFGLPDMHLFGWDDNSPMYICPGCEDAQQGVQADLAIVCDKCGRMASYPACACGNAIPRPPNH